jgi:hypothetical protein
VQQMFKWLCYGNGVSCSFLPSTAADRVQQILCGQTPETQHLQLQLSPRSDHTPSQHDLTTCPCLLCFPPADSGHAAADGSFSSRRELCFTLEGDIFVRYQSYQVGGPTATPAAPAILSATPLRSLALSQQQGTCCLPPQQPLWLTCAPSVPGVTAVVVCTYMQSAADLAADLARKVPTKIDIGPVYTHDPRQRAKYAKGEAVCRAAWPGRQALMFSVAASRRPCCWEVGGLPLPPTTITTPPHTASHVFCLTLSVYTQPASHV